MRATYKEKTSQIFLRPHVLCKVHASVLGLIKWHITRVALRF